MNPEGNTRVFFQTRNSVPQIARTVTETQSLILTCHIRGFGRTELSGASERKWASISLYRERKHMSVSGVVGHACACTERQELHSTYTHLFISLYFQDHPDYLVIFHCYPSYNESVLLSVTR